MINQLSLKPEREELQPGAVRSEEPASPEVALRALEHAAPAYHPPAVAHSLTLAAPRRSRTRTRRFWQITAIVLIVLAAGAVAARLLTNRTHPDSVFLAATEREGILNIEWDAGSKAVIGALGGTLEVAENGATRKYDLTPGDLRKGAFPVIRQSENLTAKLSLAGPNGKVRQEIAHYLGNPLPAKTDPHLAEIEQLKAQNQSLRAELEKERARANELQSWADVLESSLKKRAAR